MSFSMLIAACVTALGLPAFACAAYLATLSFAALRRRRQQATAEPHLRLAVVVPAHNEAGLIGRCVDTLTRQAYPASLFRVVVIADNCDDGTAAAALQAGAQVLVRDEPARRGKGYALRWAFDRLLAQDAALDAVVVVDADSVADSGLLAQLAAAAETADVVQADYQVLEEPTSRSALRGAAFLLFHRARFLGRAALGMGCALVGNGMLFRRTVLERVAWNATSSAEDLEYTVNLRVAGVVPRYAPEARLRAPAATGGRAGSVQRMRWEGGRFHVVRAGVPRLVHAALRSGDPAPLDMAMDLATPPLGLLVLASLTGLTAAVTTAFVAVAAPWAVAIWGAALVLITLHVSVGLYAARAPGRTYRALLAAPWFLLLKLSTYARLTRGTRADRWERTPRGSGRDDGIRPPTGGGRVDICGVPIDDVDRAGAVQAIVRAVDDATFLQVCTVNLHFLVNARRQRAVLEVMRAANLNVADGAPVVWLGRRLGALLRERVAGVDLVNDLMEEAARRQLRVFLLGGEAGAAAAAADSVRTALPGLVISGTYEPEIAPVDMLPTEAIISQLEHSRADILLVGLGHPKQDIWIHRNRDRLPVSVAIGVGCTFELLAQRRSRAPLWMQQRGLEWLYRLSQTPGRLAWRYSMCAVWFATVFAPTATLQAMRRP